MIKTTSLALCAGVGLFMFSAAKPAAATPATPALQVGATEAGVITVGRRERYWRRPVMPIGRTRIITAPTLFTDRIPITTAIRTIIVG